MFNIGNTFNTREGNAILDHYKQYNERGQSLEVDSEVLENAMACSETLVIEQNPNQIIDETSSQYQLENNTGY